LIAVRHISVADGGAYATEARSIDGVENPRRKALERASERRRDNDDDDVNDGSLITAAAAAADDPSHQSLGSARIRST